MKDLSSVLLAAVCAFHGARGDVPDPASGAPRRSGDVKTVTLPGGATMEMVWCAPGTFEMGSPQNEPGRFENEVLHKVTLTKGFWLGRCEVSQRQWESVMRSNPSKFKSPDNPVDTISWLDCQLFVRRVNTMLGGLARFPTEAEWEYACRAGSAAPVSGCGDLPRMAWFDGNSESQPHPVGGREPNAWGFRDMHGNLLEWCRDWYSVPSADDASDPVGPPSGSFKVMRGGCWFFFGRDCRSAYRLKREQNLRNCIFGFRLACSEADYERAGSGEAAK